MDRSWPTDDIKSEASEASPDQETLFKKLKSWFLFDYEKQSGWREKAREDFAFTSGDQLRLELFLSELSRVCCRHGLGITGEPVLFVMEPEDYLFNYRADEQSKLHLG
jgi:hypothetical protein